MPRTLVFTATYNEVDNIESLIREIFRNLENPDILIVDDASPDGTGELLDRLASADSRIHILHRPSKLGLGSAHLLAMKYALRHGYDFLITMDADFSHHPKYLPTMMKLMQDHDFVIGSRYAPGGHCDYGFVRSAISRTANLLARTLLGIPTREATTSYRGFSRSLLERMDLNSIWSDGYSFFMESLFLVTRVSRKLAEFPIHFEDRRAGSSKISKREILKAIYNLARLLYRRLFVLPFFKEDGRSDPPVPISCENCDSTFQMVMYPARVAPRNDASVYQCTSTGHRTHGRILRCLHCGLIFNESRHKDEEIVKFYSEVEDPDYLQNIDARTRTFRHNLNKIRPLLPRTGRLLEIGSYCGVGLKVASEMGFKVLGVEPSRWAARYSREVMEQNVIAGSLKDLPPEAGSFDVITMWDVLEHLVHPIDELRLVESRLKPGGVFVFSTLYLDNWYPKILKGRWPWFMDMHLYYFTADSLKQILRKTGFELVHQQSYTHIITLEYFFQKLQALGVPGAGLMKRMVAGTPLRNIMLPFHFGDIQMFVCRKIDQRRPVSSPSPAYAAPEAAHR